MDPASLEASPLLEQRSQSFFVRSRRRPQKEQWKGETVEVSPRKRNRLLELRSRFRSSPIVACCVLVLIVALTFKLLFLDAVEVKTPLSAAVAPAHAGVDTDVVADMNAEVSPDLNMTINPDMPTEFWDHSTFDITWGVLENYQMMQKLGEGEYSEVFQGVDLVNNQDCVVKVLKPVKKRRVKREIKILQDLRDGPNIVGLLDVARDYQNKTPSLVFEYVNNTYHKTLYPTFDDLDIRYYIFRLLEALEYSHSKGIMHRDVKPHNVMIDHAARKLRLIDWGLADFYYEGWEYTTSVASRYWRSPELLVDYEEYNPSMDIWSVGCMLAGMVFQKEPFFRGRSEVDQLVKVAKVLGTENLFKYLHKYDIELDEDFDDVSGWYPRKSWGSFVNGDNRKFISDEVIDLLDKLLRYDHNDRLTAKQALAHPYFDPVRQTAG